MPIAKHLPAASMCVVEILLVLNWHRVIAYLNKLNDLCLSLHEKNNLQSFLGLIRSNVVNAKAGNSVRLSVFFF